MGATTLLLLLLQLTLIAGTLYGIERHNWSNCSDAPSGITFHMDETQNCSQGASSTGLEDIMFSSLWDTSVATYTLYIWGDTVPYCYSPGNEVSAVANWEVSSGACVAVRPPPHTHNAPRRPCPQAITTRPNTRIRAGYLWLYKRCLREAPGRGVCLRNGLLHGLEHRVRDAFAHQRRHGL